MKPLTSTTSQHLELLFSVDDRPAAEAALLGWVEDSERLRFAALRVSHGDLRRLAEAITLGQTDWRDLLVAARFGDDVHAHEKWAPRRLTPELLAHWRLGGDVEGVLFKAGSQVQVRRGSLLGGTGVVDTLEQLEPEPTYTIRFGNGRELTVWQCDLREAA